jgi:hypothetical protein
MNNNNNVGALINGIVQGMRGVRINDRPHASQGGRSYPKEVREMVIELISNGGIESVKTPTINQLRQQKKFPSLCTCKRWMQQYIALGHIRPMRPTGNRRSYREISGQALIHLAFYRAIRPHARL